MREGRYEGKYYQSEEIPVAGQNVQNPCLLVKARMDEDSGKGRARSANQDLQACSSPLTMRVTMVEGSKVS